MTVQAWFSGGDLDVEGQALVLRVPVIDEPDAGDRRLPDQGLAQGIDGRAHLAGAQQVAEARFIPWTEGNRVEVDLGGLAGRDEALQGVPNLV